MDTCVENNKNNDISDALWAVVGCLIQGKPRVGRHEKTPEQQQRTEMIEKLTEAASTIMASGETDIYDQLKEELQHACTLLLPARGAEPEPEG